ncbi:MAG: hypothetical protein A2057_05800 [Ignavibacteria bacterium GWA2_35_9]|nr:MAG: hypothetical protein A2057_05800 [Ignavibacteria bacterium GWA2_35_9]OGU46561.1 MAG: hypothetical protein A2000_13615 [Ignavibacteria bacterium GWB2_36_8]
MKPVIIFVMIVISGIDLFPQNDSVLNFIFVPHPRSEDQVNQSIYQGIAKIDFTKYDMIMLGGDLTYSTSKDSATLAYCDNLFNLGSPNTLWSLGNHDVQSGHRALIKEFTGRESFYSYERNGVTFIVLDTELDADGFSNTFIKDDQLQMVKNVCDSIAEPGFLILLHHRFMWMINNEYFKTKLTDSIAASSRSMDTTNFYSDIYPLLREVKNRGIQVLVFSGDKSKINIEYSPEDSITFYAARMADDLPDSMNNVIILNYNLQNKEITCNFVSLEEMITSVAQEPSHLPERFVLNQNYPNPFNPNTTISFSLSSQLFVSLKVFDLIGREVASLISQELSAGTHSIQWNAEGLTSGVYFYRLQTDKSTEMKKLVLLK